jgi:hypothetical protein
VEDFANATEAYLTMCYPGEFSPRRLLQTAHRFYRLNACHGVAGRFSKRGLTVQQGF